MWWPRQVSSTSQSLVSGKDCIAPAIAKPRPPNALVTTLKDDLANMLVIIVNQDTNRGPIKIIELRGAYRPEKRGQPPQPQGKRDWYKEGNAGHRAAVRNRRALATTSNEEPDIAKAAIKGVTMPAIASGTARKL